MVEDSLKASCHGRAWDHPQGSQGITCKGSQRKQAPKGQTGAHKEGLVGTAPKGAHGPSLRIADNQHWLKQATKAYES